MRKLALVLAVGLFLAAIGFGPAAHAADTITLKAVMSWPKNATEFKAFTFFAEAVDRLVAEKAPGQLKIQFVGGPEVVKTADQAESLQRGLIDIVFTSSAYYTSLLPAADAIKLSELTPAEERANGAWAYLNELHQAKGLYYLARLGIQIPFQLYLNKPISSADLKGLNIRVSPLYLAAIKGLGGNPVVIPPTEVYAALERNVVDGYCWPSVGIRDWGWEKVTKYIVKPSFYTGPNPLLMNLASWNKLSKPLQEILTAAAQEAEKKTLELYFDLAKKEQEILTAAGLKTIDLPAAEQEKFLKVVYEEGWKAVVEKNADSGPQLKKLLTKTK